MTYYDAFIGGRGGTTSYLAGVDEEYPLQDTFNTSATLHLPRIYGKDLTAFEIASSGKIAVTLSDVYSFDLERRGESNVFLQTVEQDSMTFAADGDKYSISLNPASNVLALESQGDMSMDAGSNMVVTVGSNADWSVADTLTFNASNLMFRASNVDFETNSLEVQGDDVKLIANSNVLINALMDSIIMQSGQEMGVNAGTVMNLNAGNYVEVNTNYVRLNSHLEINGVIDSTSDIGLQVQDKVINLAFTSNLGSNLVDGPTNDGAGIVVQGVPDGFEATQSNVQFFEKSIKWKNAGGMQHLGTANIENESYWDVRGGALRITHNKTDGTELGFSLRVNQFDELELVKTVWNPDTSDYEYKRIAKFGRTLPL